MLGCEIPNLIAMIPIKIQCGCGQKYAFDIEPVGGRMPSTVACPVCGADGTAAANEAIALSPPPAAAPPPAVRLHVTPATTSPTLGSTAPRGSAVAGKKIDLAQVETEARAKVSWGDSQDDVIKFVMIQGLTVPEARRMVEPMFAERAATIRRNGFGKIIVGSLMAATPVLAYFGFMHMGYIPFKIFAVIIMFGLYGAYQAIKGTIMVIAPKSEPGDVAEQ